MIMRIAGDPAQFKQYAAANAETMIRIADESKKVGCIHHSFTAGDGEIISVDEWESAEQAQKFFAGQPEIPGVLAAAGVTGAPQIAFYPRLDAPGDF